MLTAALDAVVEAYGLDGETVGEVAAGAVLKHSRDFNLTRETVLGSRLAPETPAYDVQQACGTGLEAAILVANKIALGQVDSAIAGGVDTTSDAPLALNEDLRQLLLDLSRTKSNAGRLRSWRGCARSSSCPRSRATPSPARGCRWASTRRSWPRSGGSAATSRTSWPCASHHKLAAAYDSGWMDDLVVPFLGQERDQNLRPDSSVEKLAKLKPGVRRPRGHDDRRQLDPAVATAPPPCCWPPRSGRPSAASRCRPCSSTPRPPPSITSTSARAC